MTTISDVDLQRATRLVKLNADYANRITTVSPFATSLRELSIAHRCGVGDEGLSLASCLVCLTVSYNRLVHVVPPRSRCSLLSLDCHGDCPIQLTSREVEENDLASGSSPSLFSSKLPFTFLDVSNNPYVTSLDVCAPTLRHLIAWEGAGLNESSFREVTGLVTLDCSFLPTLSSIASFGATLERLVAMGETCGMILHLDEQNLHLFPSLAQITASTLHTPRLINEKVVVCASAPFVEVRDYIWFRKLFLLTSLTRCGVGRKKKKRYSLLKRGRLGFSSLRQRGAARRRSLQRSSARRSRTFLAFAVGKRSAGGSSSGERSGRQ